MSTTEPAGAHGTEARTSGADDRREGQVLFGYRHVSGVPRCPCADPGNYMMATQGPGPLDVVLRCWCGATAAGSFDDETERAEFLAANSAAHHVAR